MHRPADIQRKCLDPLRQLLNDPSLDAAIERSKVTDARSHTPRRFYQTTQDSTQP
jgi:hypothetical protein